MRKLALLAFLPACFIDAPTYYVPDGGADDVTDASPIDGTPADATLTTKQKPHNFGDVATGDASAALDVTVENTGTDPTGTIAVMLTGSSADQFEIIDSGVGDCDGAILAPNTTCVARVRFQPSTPAVLDSRLLLTRSQATTSVARSHTR